MRRVARGGDRGAPGTRLEPPAPGGGPTRRGGDGRDYPGGVVEAVALRDTVRGFVETGSSRAGVRSRGAPGLDASEARS